MKFYKFLVVIICVCLFALAKASDRILTFKPTATASASIRIENRLVHVDVHDSHVGGRSQEIQLDTETVPHIIVADYGFDGTKGFSIWYLDEGMGTSTISRVFLYSPIRHIFLEIQPKCGDEFVNLRVDRVKHVLLSTYYEGNEPKLCQTDTKRSGF